VIDDLEWTFDLQTSVYDFLKSDYDILQAINHEIAQAPIRPNIRWVKGHQDDHTAPEDLTNEAVANYYADKICDLMHQYPDNQVGRFPGWMPYPNAGLLYQGRLVTKKQDHHVTTAATATALQDTIIKDSKKQDPTIDAEWTEDTFESVDWQANGSSFKALAPGQQLQISKYAHEWTPTMHH
jgi:hypothetical protein